MADVIQAQGLVKRFGEVVALDGLDVTVSEGTVVALLGPNGAGKTTAVRILTTLIVPDAGTATVAGHDVLTQPRQVRRHIGLSGQFTAIDEYLTGFENLDMIGRLSRLEAKESRQRARRLLDVFHLDDAGDRPVKGYSGGMRRRLDLAAAIVAEPSVLFLDEPTTGLDPRSRVDLWETIRELVDRGTTLLLTTQYLEEADRFADDILVIDHGREIARGTADQLKSQIGGERVEVAIRHPENLDRAKAALARMSVGEVVVEDHSRKLTAPVSGAAGQVLTDVLRELDDGSIEILDIGIRRPTLDDVFIALTGHAAEDAGEPESQEVTS